MKTDSWPSALPLPGVRRWAIMSLVAVLVTVAQACGFSIPPNFTYQRIPEGYEEVHRPPEVVEVDNCESDVAIERTVSRSIQLGETVTLDEEQAQSIGLQAGVSNIVAVLGEVQSEVAQKFGAGLMGGQAKEESIAVYVNPHRKALVTLHWKETWEHGRFVVYKDGNQIGNVTYNLLRDIDLDSRIQSVDCGWGGRVRSGIATFWNTSVTTAWNKAKVSWPLSHLAVTLSTVGIVYTASVLVWRRWRRRPHREDELYEEYR